MSEPIDWIDDTIHRDNPTVGDNGALQAAQTEWCEPDAQQAGDDH